MLDAFITCVSLFSGLTSGQLSFQTDKDVVKVGETFTLTCYLEPIPAGLILYFEKVVEGAEDNNIKISTNNRLDAALPEEVKNRYDLHAVQEGEGYRFTLNISSKS